MQYNICEVYVHYKKTQFVERCTVALWIIHTNNKSFFPPEICCMLFWIVVCGIMYILNDVSDKTFVIYIIFDEVAKQGIVWKCCSLILQDATFFDFSTFKFDLLLQFHFCEQIGFTFLVRISWLDHCLGKAWGSCVDNVYRVRKTTRLLLIWMLCSAVVECSIYCLFFFTKLYCMNVYNFYKKWNILGYQYSLDIYIVRFSFT